MNRQSILQQIDVLVKALTEQQEQLRESSGTIPQMSIDLVLQNTRQLYEAVLLLNHTNALSSLDEVKAAVTQRILAEKKMIEAKTAEVKKAEQKTPEPVEKKEVPKPVQHADIEEVMVRADAPRAVEETSEKGSKAKKISGGMNATLFEGAHTLAEHFSDEESLHEHIAAKVPGKTLADNLHRKPVSDLKAAIGINEKFSFINQLFDGNLQEYSSAIDKLNNASSLDAAKQLITGELASRFHWASDNEQVQHFIDLVERRFIA